MNRRSFDYDVWIQSAPPQNSQDYAVSPLDLGSNPMDDSHDAAVMKILKKRAGEPTDVVLSSGQVLRVFNIAWTYDLGDPAGIIFSNISPPPDVEHSADTFRTTEVVRIVDPETGVAWLDLAHSSSR